ncbi:hypothetical protein KHQ81_06070 [Mycoplasmatota bacterium]|nr:hypothetical protein KHQ81_06070 [Mycoplasmatota bacterium]
MKVYKFNRIKIFYYTIFYTLLISIFTMYYSKNLGSYITIILLTIVLGSILLKQELSYRISLHSTHLHFDYFIVSRNKPIDIYWDNITKVTYKIGMVILYVNNKKIFFTRSLLNYKELWQEIYDNVIQYDSDNIMDDSFIKLIKHLANG